MRAAPILAGIVALLTALSACGQQADPAAPAADPTPAAPPTAPAPAPPTPTPAPSLSPLPAAFSLGDRSDGSQGPYEAPGFSLVGGFGERFTLDGFLAERRAVVLVFYRGFF